MTKLSLPSSVSIIFLALIVYLKVPGMMAKSLDDRADQIRNELAEAKRLREEAQHLLAEYQRKRKEAEAEAAHIVAAAEREAEMLTDGSTKKTEEFVANRTALSEQKIKQAEADAMKAVRSLIGLPGDARPKSNPATAARPASARRSVVRMRTSSVSLAIVDKLYTVREHVQYRNRARAHASGQSAWRVSSATIACIA